MTEERISARQWAETLSLGLGEQKYPEGVLRLMTKYYAVRVHCGDKYADTGSFLSRDNAEKAAVSFAGKDGVDRVEIIEDVRE